MDEILTYDLVKSQVLAKIAEMVRWNNADMVSETTTKGRVKRAQQENDYLEYLARCIVNLPMPD